MKDAEIGILFFIFSYMKRKKYKVKFYTLKGTFFKICTRSYISTLKFALRIAIKQIGVFTIKEHKNYAK